MRISTHGFEKIEYHDLIFDKVETIFSRYSEDVLTCHTEYILWKKSIGKGKKGKQKHIHMNTFLDNWPPPAFQREREEEEEEKASQGSAQRWRNPLSHTHPSTTLFYPLHVRSLAQTWCVLFVFVRSNTTAKGRGRVRRSSRGLLTL